MTMHDFIELWLETYIAPKRAENTVRAYRFALAHLSGGILRTDLPDVDPLQLQREINTLAATYSRQAQILYQALRSIFKRAMRLDLVKSSPMERVDPPAHEKSEAKTMSKEEAAAYFRAAAGCPLLRLMLCMGLRRNEARGLYFGDFADGVLSIRRQRTKSGFSRLKSRSSRRDLPVPEPLWALFNGPSGELVENISESSLRRQHLRVCRSIGVVGVTLHGLRHTAATLAAADNVPLSSIQHLLGHKHVSLTADLYVHADMHALARCTRIIYNDFGIPYEEGARLEIV